MSELNDNTVLVTGGAGYIGSHVCVALAAAGFAPVIVDDFSNAQDQAVDGIGKIIGERPPCYRIDVRETDALGDIMRRHAAGSVIHLAAKKSVEESVASPLDYYDCNVGGLVSTLKAMTDTGTRSIVYSSSATVYAPGESGICSETSPLGPINPYGHSKLFGEQIMADHCGSSGACAAILRYFNPVGAHDSGMIGESPRGRPSNLMPLVASVAAGARTDLSIFGSDYPTPDGTAIRDYIHVMDVAEAHVAALRHLLGKKENILLNIGTGTGYSVLQIVEAYQRVNNVTVAHRMAPRRAGDAAHVQADASRADHLLGWRARRGLDEMCESLHRWTENCANASMKD